MIRKPPFQYGDLEFELGEGHSNLGKIKSRSWSLQQLADMLRKPVKDNVTLKQYLRLPREEQDRRKNVGFWLGGPSADDRRKNTSLRHRSVVTLDLDEGTPEIVDKLREGRAKLCRYSFLVHSTRKHTPERPRLRIVIPLAAPLPTDHYTAAARILARMVDATMDAIDDVSFRPAQMMFKPSVCAEAEFLFWQNEGELCDAQEVLDRFGDWQDYTKLPFSERQGQKRPVDPNRKAENPLEKKGLVGAFCRTYDVEQAIAKFLPDVYELGDSDSTKPRYTFLGGTTTNGAVVEDDGLFLYSHHTSDPCTDRLVNAFDLVRIHKFGDQDEGHDEKDTKPVDMPSFKAMEDFLADDAPTVRQRRDDRYDVAAIFRDHGPDDNETEAAAVPDLAGKFEDYGDEDTDDLASLIGEPSDKPEKAKAEEPDVGWLDDLEVTPKGGIKCSMPNYSIILQNDPRLKPSIELNEFTREIVTRRAIKTNLKTVSLVQVKDPVNGDLWSNLHDTTVRHVLEAPAGKGKAGYGLKVSDRDLRGAIEASAAKRRFHPVRDYLDGLTWDGKPRVETLFIDYLGAGDNPYTREVSLLFCIAAVTRVYEPGHKFDFVPILEGAQGKRKSTFIRVLSAGWFTELQGDFHDTRKLVETMQGAWINEIPELSSFSRSEVNQTKAFISATEDKIRLAYAARAEVYPRQCVFMGSTNEHAYLLDQTGGRRFWPIKCQTASIDTDRLAREVGQVWAEARALYLEMRKKQPKGTLPLYLRNPDAQRIALEEQEGRRLHTEVDTTAGQILGWVDTPVPPSALTGAAARFENLDEDEEPVLRDAVCLVEVWEEGLGNDRKSLKRAEVLSLANAMRLIGWVADQKPSRTKDYGHQKLWRRPK